MQTDATRGANDLEAGGSHACRGPWTPDTLAKERGPGLLLNCLQCSFMSVFPRAGAGMWTAWAPNLWNLIHVHEPWAGSSLDRECAGRVSDTRSAFLPKYGFKCENTPGNTNTSVTVNSSVPLSWSQTTVVSEGALREVIGHCCPEQGPLAAQTPPSLPPSVRLQA